MDGCSVAVSPHYNNRGQHVQRGIKLQAITKNTHFTISYLQVLAIEALVKWRLYSLLTANPKAEALWRMTETAGEKQRERNIHKRQIYTYFHSSLTQS